MGKFYSSKLYALAVMLYRLMLLNILTVVCSIPVFTAGPALCGLYGAVYNMLKEQGSVVGDFFGNFKKCFKRSVGHLLLFLLLAAIASVNIYAERTYLSSEFSFIVMVFTILILVACLFTAAYIFPLLPHFRAPFLQSIRIALFFAFKYLPRTIIIVILNLLPWVLLYFSTHAFVMILPVWGLLAFSVIACINTKLLRPVIEEMNEALEEQEREEAAEREEA